jgi:DNA relaxase NicK
MDSWTDDTAYENFVKRRETKENWKKQSIKQDFRARAADLRSDFAKATNDYIQPAGLKNKSIVGG